ncbi:MAG: hypothetical protein JW959_08005 [Pirellulales bacterium]|nr:hypothetical protein [Pirellulales bacterium]
MEKRHSLTTVLLLEIVFLYASVAATAEPPGAASAAKYFAHPAVEDQYGVIAPWYRGQNGQCDFRVRIAAETLKRYPWADAAQSEAPGPHYIFNGGWKISLDGAISVDVPRAQLINGDLGQRSASLLFGMTDYYRYTGDPAAIGIVALTADYLLDFCQTPADHPWPKFFISCPVKGKAYGRADPHGYIQLDLTAYVGSGMLEAYQLTGNKRYWEAAKHWADVLAEHRDRRPGAQPWGRYANPEDIPWKDNTLTGSIVYILKFLNEIIDLGYTGKDGALVEARAVGEKYFRKVLLPRWTLDPTFGHHFWDWQNPVATCSVPCLAAEYMMDRREAFPNWRNDVRNVTSVFFCRSSVYDLSAGGIYSGAWAFPESSSCCADALQYPTVVFAATLARYGALADSAWAEEVARRQTILTTYDALETGVVIDGVRGGVVTAGDWFNLAHPWPLRCVLDMLAWQPEKMGAGRENHIMRSASVVDNVHYGKGIVRYTSLYAPSGGEDVLRLAFRPASVTANGTLLPPREKLSENGYSVKPLSNGDFLVVVRRVGCRRVEIRGDDPQETISADGLKYTGKWSSRPSPDALSGPFRAADAAGAGAEFEFTGNQVRVIGSVGPGGGRADVYLDGAKQLCGIDFWCPMTRCGQVVYYKNGLPQGKHTLKIVATGTRNPSARGTEVCLEGLQWSAAEGANDFGAGSGPAGPQRVIFGYTGRKDYVDSAGNSWRPATEFVMRLRNGADLVPISFWTEPRLQNVENTADPELYRYGVHGNEFTAYFTVDPSVEKYYVRIKLCEPDAKAADGRSATSIDIQGQNVARDVDVAATAKGHGKAVDLTFNDISPEHGVIAVRFWHTGKGQAICQAVEIGPGKTDAGVEPTPFRFPTQAQ